MNRDTPTSSAYIPIGKPSIVFLQIVVNLQFR